MSRRPRIAVIVAGLILLVGAGHAAAAAIRQGQHPEWSAPPSAAMLSVAIPYAVAAALAYVLIRFKTARR